MIWNNHKELEGKHAFLGASQFRWINWDNSTLLERYYGQFAQDIGTVMHNLASECINARVKLNENDINLVELKLRKNYIPSAAYNAETLLLNMIPFVEDAIGFRMASEVVLFYSRNCFGTADAIVLDEKNKILRIHDLKTGVTPAHAEQLMIYAALFFLEYKKKPKEYKTILRIYQNFEVLEINPEAMEIEKYMKMIVDTDNILNMLK